MPHTPTMPLITRASQSSNLTSLQQHLDTPTMPLSHPTWMTLTTPTTLQPSCLNSNHASHYNHASHHPASQSSQSSQSSNLTSLQQHLDTPTMSLITPPLGHPTWMTLTTPTTLQPSLTSNCASHSNHASSPLPLSPPT